jgi:hypothetical protein
VATAGTKEDRKATEAATVVMRAATAGTKEDRRATEAATVVMRAPRRVILSAGAQA